MPSAGVCRFVSGRAHGRQESDADVPVCQQLGARLHTVIRRRGLRPPQPQYGCTYWKSFSRFS